MLSIPVHELVPTLNMLMLMAVLVWVAFIWVKARGWSVRSQDEKLRALRVDVDSQQRKIDLSAREFAHDIRTRNDSAEAMLREIRSIGELVSSLLTMRDELHDVKGQATTLEQDLRSLVCFEDARLRKSELPGFCPLRKVECPIEREMPRALIVPLSTIAKDPE